MCLRLVFLLITRIAAWLRLSRREEAWKTAEILLLRHQLAVLQRQQPHRLKLNWADRALLATLLGVIPKARRQGLRLLITSETICVGTVTSSTTAGPRGPCAARPAARPPAGTSRPWSAGWPGKSRLGIPQDPRRTGGSGRQSRSVDRVGDPQGQRHQPRPAAGRADLASVPALSGRCDPGKRLLHGRPARRYPGLRPGRDRARQQAHPHPRSHFASHRGVDRSAGPESDDGSR